MITHREPGVPWYKAPIPRRLHRCTVWTRGTVEDPLTRRTVDRCACGAFRVDGGWWHDRNRRAKARRRTGR